MAGLVKVSRKGAKAQRQCSLASLISADSYLSACWPSFSARGAVERRPETIIRPALRNNGIDGTDARDIVKIGVNFSSVTRNITGWIIEL